MTGVELAAIAALFLWKKKFEVRGSKEEPHMILPKERQP